MVVRVEPFLRNIGIFCFSHCIESLLNLVLTKILNHVKVFEIGTAGKYV